MPIIGFDGLESWKDPTGIKTASWKYGSIPKVKMVIAAPTEKTLLTDLESVQKPA